MAGRWCNTSTILLGILWDALGTPFWPPGSKGELKHNSQWTKLELVWGRRGTFCVFLKILSHHLEPTFSQQGPGRIPERLPKGAFGKWEAGGPTPQTFYWKFYGRHWEHQFGHQGPRKSSSTTPKGQCWNWCGGGLAPLTFF